MIEPDTRVAHHGRLGTVVDNTDRDTWPLLRGKYHPGSPYGPTWTLVRWDDWPDDEWTPTDELVTDDPDAGVRAMVRQRKGEGEPSGVPAMRAGRRADVYQPSDGTRVGARARVCHQDTRRAGRVR